QPHPAPARPELPAGSRRASERRRWSDSLRESGREFHAVVVENSCSFAAHLSHAVASSAWTSGTIVTHCNRQTSLRFGPLGNSLNPSIPVGLDGTLLRFMIEYGLTAAPSRQAHMMPWNEESDNGRGICASRGPRLDGLAGRALERSES